MSNNKNELIPDAPLTPEEISTMVRGMLHFPQLLADAISAGFDASVFSNNSELPYFYLVGVMIDLYKAHQSFTPEMINTALLSRISRPDPVTNMPCILTEDEKTALIGDDKHPGFIRESMAPTGLSPEQISAYKKFCEEILRRFMTTRIVKGRLQTILNSPGELDSAPRNMHTVLEEWQQRAQRIAGIGVSVKNTAMMPEFGGNILLPPPATPTTIPWIDNYIGGFRPGDIIGVLGPFGGGKTTMLVSATVRMAEQYYLRGEKKLAVYVGFEDGNEKMNYLFWSAAGRIDRKLFLNGGSPADVWASFSTSSSLKPYDKNLPENKNGKILLGERERWEMSMKWLNSHMCYLDFSHSDADKSRGKGGAEEIAAAIDRLVEETGMEVGLLSIDYAGLVVERMLDKAGDKFRYQEQITRPIKQLPDQLRRAISDRHKCTILLAHQLAPGETAKTATHKYIDHTSSQGGKSFAENLHSCVCINKRDPDTGVSTFYWSKIRAILPESPFGLIKIDDNWVGMHIATDYVVCPMARKIMKKGDVRPASREDTARNAKKFDGRDTFSTDFLS